MHTLQFLESSGDRTLTLSGSYDVVLVPVSVLIVSLASYAAFGLAGRIVAAKTQRAKRLWLLAGAGAMGVGIWAMHFIGMLAFQLPIPVAYDVGITLVSVAPAVLASYVVLFVIGKAGIQRLQLVLCGTLMGLGIGTIHYTAMGAAYFFPAAGPTALGAVLEPTLLAILVSLAAVIILSLAIFVVIVDARLKAAAVSVRTSRAHMI